MVIPQSVFAAEPGRASVASRTSQSSPVTDVALQRGGVLVGQIINHRNQAVSTQVAIHSGRRVVAKTTTDQNGVFRVRGLRGGVHTISTGSMVQRVRLWHENTAPPVAKPSLRMVSKPIVVRGQEPEVLYDENGNPYGRVRVMADPPTEQFAQGEVVDNGGGFGMVEGGGFLGGLDIVTTTILAASIAGVTIAAINLDDINELEDRVDRIPVSP
ncbi:MAG: hypothetical protein CMJ78_22300 [Planctomycetaceae bacterium]|nr:hypothetical protein [Planctomycetaceae bacterium]